MAERKAKAEAKHEEAKAVQREIENSFEKVARKWWAWWSIGKSPRHSETLMNRLEADVFPVIGHLPIDAVQTTDIREIMLTVVTRPIAGVTWTVDSALIVGRAKSHKTLPRLVKELRKRFRTLAKLPPAKPVRSVRLSIGDQTLPLFGIS